MLTGFMYMLIDMSYKFTDLCFCDSCSERNVYVGEVLDLGESFAKHFLLVYIYVQLPVHIDKQTNKHTLTTSSTHIKIKQINKQLIQNVTYQHT